MRYLELARVLASDLDVTLASPYPSDLSPANFRLAQYSELNPAALRRLVEAHDVALISGYLVDQFPFLRTTTTRLIVDLVTPFVLENLHHYLDQPLDVRDRFQRQAVNVTNQLAQVGDFFICGSERQRDFWLGVLAANQRLNPRTVGPDSAAWNLIDVVGFGLPERAPARQRAVLREAHPRFGPESKIVWWGGGMWDWLDPMTLIRAWPQVSGRHPEARLVFLRAQPNPGVPQPRQAVEVERWAVEQGVRDHTVFFLDWLAYDDREAL